MSVLDNQKHEAFAQAYVRTNNGVKAAIEAGYAPSGSRNAASVRAAGLMKNAKVKARIDELQQQLTKKASQAVALDRAWVLDRLKQNADLALDEKDRSAANRALELLGKEIGMFVERKQLQIGPLEQLGAPQLQRLLLLAEAAEQGRLTLPQPVEIIGEIIDAEVEEDVDVLG
jgi:Terminase small subunit